MGSAYGLREGLLCRLLVEESWSEAGERRPIKAVESDSDGELWSSSEAKRLGSTEVENCVCVCARACMCVRACVCACVCVLAYIPHVFEALI